MSKKAYANEWCFFTILVVVAVVVFQLTITTISLVVVDKNRFILSVGRQQKQQQQYFVQAWTTSRTTTITTRICTRQNIFSRNMIPRILRIKIKNDVNILRFHSITSSLLAATTISTIGSTTSNIIEEKSSLPPIYIGVIGGGASGIFASIAAANALSSSDDYNHVNKPNIYVIVLEATNDTLRKVKISGGGRCNVLHDTSKSISNILNNGYPNGHNELKSIYYNKFTPLDSQKWFEKHGVILKTELDGRMFPITDTSQTIIDTLLHNAIQSNVTIYKKCPIQTIMPIIKERTHIIDTTVNDDHQKQHHQYQIVLNKKIESIDDNNNNNDLHRMIENIRFDAIILATGSAPIGYKIAKSLGHHIIPPVPSLFTLNTKESLFQNLAGISVEYVKIRYRINQNQVVDDDTTTTTTQIVADVIDDVPITTKKKKPKNSNKKYIEQDGPLLITHNGLSGPAILRLSAFGSREFHEQKYSGTIIINWLPTIGNNLEEIYNELWKLTSSTLSKRIIASKCPFYIDLNKLPSIPGVKIHHRNNNNDVVHHQNDDNDMFDYQDDQLADDESNNNKKSAIPRRLWYSIVQKAGINDTMLWGTISKKLIRQLANILYECSIEINGKNINKDEFTTSGGIDCSNDIDMKTMSSKINSNIHFCGEIINVDGITGGFNFMSCWSTGYVAGTSAVYKCIQDQETSISITTTTNSTTTTTTKTRSTTIL